MSKLNIELKEGQKIRISHYRTVDYDTGTTKLTKGQPLRVNKYAGKSFRKFELDVLVKAGYTIGTKGGKTVATLEDVDGTIIAAGVSICSREDTFSRKLGNKIATGRLAQMIEDIDVWWFPEVEADIVTEAYTRVERPHYSPKKVQYR